MVGGKPDMLVFEKLPEHGAYMASRLIKSLGSTK
jgi:hypothetical protein